MLVLLHVITGRSELSTLQLGPVGAPSAGDFFSFAEALADDPLEGESGRRRTLENGSIRAGFETSAHVH